jgi:hypothetical protein
VDKIGHSLSQDPDKDIGDEYQNEKGIEQAGNYSQTDDSGAKDPHVARKNGIVRTYSSQA